MELARAAAGVERLDLAVGTSAASQHCLKCWQAEPPRLWVLPILLLLCDAWQSTRRQSG